MPQYGVPINDFSVSSWSEVAGNGDANAWDELDEGISTTSGHDGTTTFWTSPPLGGAQLQQFHMEISTLTDPLVSDRHTIKAVVRKDPATPIGTINTQLQLIAPSVINGGVDAVIATHSLAITATAWTTISYELTGAQANDISTTSGYQTARMSLRPFITANSGVQLHCTAMEFKVPLGNQPKLTMGIGADEREDATEGITPEYRVGIDMTNGGSFTNITSGGFVQQMSWGRQIASIRDDIKDGDATLILDNVDGRFSPEYTAGTYYGQLTRNREMKIEVVFQGSKHALFHGYTESFAVNPEIGDRTASIECVDRMGKIGDRKLDMPLLSEYPVSSLVSVVLSHAGLTATQQSVDTLGEIVPYAAFGEEKASKALEEIIQVGDYRAFVAGNGVVRFAGRQFGNEGTSVASFNEFLSFPYEFGGLPVANQVRITSEPKRVRTSVGTVGYIEEAIAIPATSHLAFELDFVDSDDENTSRTPAASVTVAAFTANANSGGGGADKTSAVSRAIATFAKTAVTTFYNSDSGEVFITEYVLRGYSLQNLAEISVVSDDSSSQALYGLSAFEISSDMIGRQAYAKLYSDYVLEELKGVTAQVGATIKYDPANPTSNEIFKMELGQVISITESLTGVNSAFTVVGMEHEVRMSAGQEHTVNLDLRRYLDRRWLIADHATQGQADEEVAGF